MRLLVLISAFLIGVIFPLAAQSAGGVLDRMKAGNVITLGYSPRLFPYSYEGGDHKPIGYTIDLCKLILERIRTKTDLPRLRLRLISLRVANRVAMVANGTVDMYCSFSTDTPSREDAVSFIGPIYYANTGFVVPASSRITTLDDLAGKRILVAGGTTNNQVLESLNSDRLLNLIIVPVSDFSVGLHLLEGGTGDALLSTDGLTVPGIIQSGKTDAFRLLGQKLSPRRNGIMIRRSDAAFNEAAREAFRDLDRSGEIEKNYRLWFESPIPTESGLPGGVTLNIPMSDELRSEWTALRTEVSPGR